MYNELKFICNIDENLMDDAIGALEDINKKKLKTFEIKRWTNKRIMTSHESLLKYFELLHRLNAFDSAVVQLTKYNNSNDIYYKYLNVLFIILCNHNRFEYYHHRIYALCVQKLCTILPTFQ